ncbi:MAG: hypothetical protein WBV67_07580 [Candidatus Cybelea sp.]|jgi:hypothetical protein
MPVVSFYNYKGRVPVRVIAEAMGASISHGSKVRGGKLAPHKRHWKVLHDLAAHGESAVSR